MSKEINNRQYRQEVIRELLQELHEGKTVDEVKAKFQATFDGVSSSEISEAEQALIKAGMPVSEVQRLCDVHAAVFKDSLIQEELAPEALAEMPGHPAHTMREENRALERLIEGEVMPALEAWLQNDSALPELQKAIRTLGGINQHYLRKENLLFPYMERHGITAPPKVMWGVDDEIRSMIKRAGELSQSPSPDKTQLTSELNEAISKVNEMIFKEENIMLPMLLEALDPTEWKSIADESDELGYTLIPTPPTWNHQTNPQEDTEGSLVGDIVMPTGVLQLNELTNMLDTLPVDITFVDKNDTVKYFSKTAERVFPRTKAIIGRKVANCHPPASVHIVEGILNDFKSGKKTHEDFWIKMGGMYIYIRYFAVKDENGEYLGTLEVTQNIAPIQELSGEKRLVEK